MINSRRLAILGAVILFVLVDTALWYFSVTAGDKVRPAFVGAASAWGVAIVGILAALMGAFSGAQLEQKAAFTTERRIAYARLLAFADEYVDANANFNEADKADGDAQESLKNIKEQLERNPGSKELQNAVVIATATAANTEKWLASATAKAKGLVSAYRSAAGIVELLAPASVTFALERFVQSLNDSTINRDTARAGFVAAARSNLGLSVNRADVASTAATHRDTESAAVKSG
jgi:hypothetical protein